MSQQAAIDEQLAAAIAGLLSESTYDTQAATGLEWATEFDAAQVWLPSIKPEDCPTPRVQVVGRTRKTEPETRQDDDETIEIDVCLACHVDQHDAARIGELNRLAEQLSDAIRGAAQFPALDATFTSYTRSPLWDRRILTEANVFVTVVTTVWSVIRAV